MLDHMTFCVTDIAAVRKLYEAALAPLGYVGIRRAHHARLPPRMESTKPFGRRCVLRRSPR